MLIGWGEFFSLASALVWAIGVILYRQLGASLPPVTLNFLKNSLVLLMLVPTTLVLQGVTPPDFSREQLLLALASGAIGIAVADTLYFRALNELGAGRMGVLGNFYSPFVILLSVLFLAERLNAWQIGGFVMVSLGVLLSAWPRASEPRPAHVLRGLLYGLASIGLMAVAVVMVKRVLEAQPLLWVTLVRMVGALATLAVITVLLGRGGELRPPAAMPWRRLLLAAFVGQFLAMILWLAGYKFTQASVAAILNETASVFILLLAWWWLKEPLTRRGIAGVVLTLSGVALMLTHP